MHLVPVEKVTTFQLLPLCSQRRINNLLFHCINRPRLLLLLAHAVCQWARCTVCACLCSALLRLMEPKGRRAVQPCGCKKPAAPLSACQNRDMPADVCVCVCVLCEGYLCVSAGRTRRCVFDGGVSGRRRVDSLVSCQQFNAGRDHCLCDTCGPQATTAHA